MTSKSRAEQERLAEEEAALSGKVRAAQNWASRAEIGDTDFLGTSPHEQTDSSPEKPNWWEELVDVMHGKPKLDRPRTPEEIGADNKLKEELLARNPKDKPRNPGIFEIKPDGTSANANRRSRSIYTTKQGPATGDEKRRFGKKGTKA